MNIKNINIPQIKEKQLIKKNILTKLLNGLIYLIVMSNRLTKIHLWEIIKVYWIIMPIIIN